MDFIKAFIAGGMFCVIGQLLIDLTRLTPAKILVSYVVAGVFLGAVGFYKPFAEWAGAGATVPLVGFGNVLAQGVKEAVAEKGALGAITGGFSAGAAGLTAAVVAALIVAVLFRPREKA